MNSRNLRTIHALGMCEDGSEMGEPITLPNGDELSVIKEPSDGVCVAMGGLAARYTTEELEIIGDGNLNTGMLRVVQVLRTAPTEFEHGAPRPFEPIQ